MLADIPSCTRGALSARRCTAKLHGDAMSDIHDSGAARNFPRGLHHSFARNDPERMMRQVPRPIPTTPFVRQGSIGEGDARFCLSLRFAGLCTSPEFGHTLAGYAVNVMQ